MTSISNVFAVTAAMLLLASSAAGWGLSSKASEQNDGIRMLPQSSTGAPEFVRDHYWWNPTTGMFLKYPKLY